MGKAEEQKPEVKIVKKIEKLTVIVVESSAVTDDAVKVFLSKATDVMPKWDRFKLVYGRRVAWDAVSFCYSRNSIQIFCELSEDVGEYEWGICVIDDYYNQVIVCASCM